MNEPQLAVLDTRRGPSQHAGFLPGGYATGVLARQALEAIAQFEKATTVAKLRAARDRKRARTGKCVGASPTPRPIPS
jgi:hypothetical protein